MLGEASTENHRKDHQEDGRNGVLFMVIVVGTLVVMPVFMAVIMSTTHFAPGMDKVEGAEADQGQASAECDQVKRLTEVFPDQTPGVEIDRNDTPRDGGEPGDDLVESALVHGGGQLFCHALGEGRIILFLHFFKQSFIVRWLFFVAPWCFNNSSFVFHCFPLCPFMFTCVLCLPHISLFFLVCP